MDKALFLAYCITNTLLYSLLRYFHFQIPKYSTMEIMGYSNILSLIITIPYALFSIKNIIKGFTKYSGFMINVLASYLKVYVVQHISPRNAMVISFTQPIFVVLLSILTVEKSFKFEIKKYLYIPFSLIGIVIFVGFDFQKYSFVYLIMFLHVIMKAFSGVYMKKVSGNKYISLFYSLFFYAIFGFTVIIFKHPFIWQMIFNKYVVILSIISIVCQLAIIKSYEITERISLLQNLDYSRIGFSFLWTLWLFNEPILMNQVIGVSVVIISIYFSQFDIKVLKKIKK